VRKFALPCPENPLAYAWFVVLALWPVAMLNYLDRQMFATIRVSMRADIPSIAGDKDFGMLMAVFLWVYALLSPFGGFIADRFNRRWTVIGSLFVWSVVTWMTGEMQTYQQMLICRGLMGISEAFYFPAALALISDFHIGGTRSRAIGIHQSGVYAGLALGGVGGYIAQAGSWRNGFVWFGLAGVIYALALMVVLKDAPAATVNRQSSGTRLSMAACMRALGTQPAYWILVAYFTLPAIGGWAMKNWLPTFLAARFNLEEGPAGLSGTGYTHVASFAGVLLGGALADRWMKTSPRGRIYTSAVGTMLLVPALLGVASAWSLAAAIGFMVLFGLGWGFFDCNNMPILCEIARPEYRATGYGFMNLVSISVGGGAMVVLGWMRDRGISFGFAFAICAGLALLSAAMILWVKPRAGSHTP